MPEDINSPRKDYLNPAPQNAGVYLKVVIQPSTSKEAIIGPYNGSLKVKVSTPLVEGAANKALINLFSKLLGTAKGNIVIKQGESSRQKLLLIKDVTLSEAKENIYAAIWKNKK